MRSLENRPHFQEKHFCRNWSFLPEPIYILILGIYKFFSQIARILRYKRYAMNSGLT